MGLDGSNPNSYFATVEPQTTVPTQAQGSSYWDALVDVWGSMGETWENVTTAGGQVIGEAWDTTISAPSRAWSAVKEEVREVVSDVSQTATGAFDWLQGTIFMWIGVLLIGIWVIAKSGILNQLAGLKPV